MTDEDVEKIITDSNGRKHITNEPQLHPPQRPSRSDMTWVGLTDEEVAELSRHELWVKNFIRQIEEKLRIKNT